MSNQIRCVVSLMLALCITSAGMCDSPSASLPKLSKDSAGQALEYLRKTYEAKDFASFIGMISDEFPYRGELEEFVRRDFRDYDSIRLNFYINRSVVTPTGIDINTDWEIRYFTSSTSKQIRLRGENLNLSFVSEEAQIKLKSMRGKNPLFGARSPEIAASAGVSSSIVALLQEIQDTGTRTAQQAALTLVATTGSFGPFQDQAPVSLEITGIDAEYSDGFATVVPFTAISFTHPIYLYLNVRIINNPTNISLSNVEFRVTDSATGRTLRGSGPVRAGQIASLRTDGVMTFNSASQMGTFDFTLDPDRKLNLLNREDATDSQIYACTV